MTREEALQAVQDELDGIEEDDGVALFHLTDTGRQITCRFNDPRYKDIIIDYDHWED